MITKILKPLIYLIIIVAIGTAIAFKLKENKATIQSQAEMGGNISTRTEVTVVLPTAQNPNGDFVVNGFLEPAKQITFLSDVSGKVTALYIDNGTQVSEGQTVALIDNDLINNQLQMAQTSLDNVNKNIARYERLLKEGGVTQQQYEGLTLERDNTLTQIKNLQKQLANTTLKAPISGTITNKMIEKGAFLAPGAPVATILNISKLYMNAYVTEQEVVLIKKGQTADVQLDVMPDKILKGTIKLIDIKADPSKRYLVQIELPNPSNTLKANMSGKVTFGNKTQSTAQILSVPRICLGDDSHKKNKLYIVENDSIIKEINVEFGKIINNKIEVLNGLKPTDKVVSSGHINIVNGEKVKILP